MERELQVIVEKNGAISVSVVRDRRSLRHPAILAVTLDNKLGIRLAGALFDIRDVEGLVEKAIGRGEIEPIEKEGDPTEEE